MADPYKEYKKKILQHAADKADPETREELEDQKQAEDVTDEKSTPEQIKDFFNRLRGRDPEKEAAIKKRAEEAIAQHEKQYGPTPEEPGIEEDYTLEDTASLAFGGPAAQMGKRALGMAARKVGSEAADSAKKIAVSNQTRDNLRKLARGQSSDVSARLEKDPAALQGMMKDLKKEGIYTKQGQLQRAADISNIKKRTEVRSNPSEGPALNYKEMNRTDIPEPRTIDYGKQGPMKVKADLEKLEGPTYNKMNRDPSSEIKVLQKDMEMANRSGDYQKAKDLLQQIREKREKVGY